MNITFIESARFQKIREEVFGGDEGFRLFQAALMRNARVGDVIPGTGGVRKVRWASAKQAKGKRGGVRVLYLYVEEQAQIFLLAAYTKNEMENPTPKQMREIADSAQSERSE